MDLTRSMTRKTCTVALFLCFLQLLYWVFGLRRFDNGRDFVITGDIIAKNDHVDCNGIGIGSNASKEIESLKFEVVPTNQNSPYVQSDVSEIIHVPAENRIEVHLKQKSVRRCQNPVFKGRISGWSLTMIDFGTSNNTTTTNNNNNNNVIVGTYERSHIPISGTYYLEILVLLCERYDETNFLNLELATVCVEDVENINNRITAGDGSASILITMRDNKFFETKTTTTTTTTTTSKSRHSPSSSSSGSNNKYTTGTTTTTRSRGTWLFNSLIKNDNASQQQQQQPLESITTTNTNYTGVTSIEIANSIGGSFPKPLYTLSQPAGLCGKKPLGRNLSSRESRRTKREKNKKGKKICSAQHERFEVYTFRWNPGPYEELNDPGLSPLLPLSPPANEETIIDVDNSDSDSNDSLQNRRRHSQRRQQQQQQQHNDIHICFVGESHSRYLRFHCHKLLKQQLEKMKGTEGNNNSNITVLETHGFDRTSTSSIPNYLTCSAVRVRYPDRISDKVSDILELGCTHAVMGFFQHFFYSSADRIGSNLTFALWKTEMSEAVQRLATVAKDPASSLRNVVLRSAHPNGLKSDIVMCPTSDHRHPPNADLATRILKEIVKESNRQQQPPAQNNIRDGDAEAIPSPSDNRIVSFLDTSFLIGPVWDSAPDWNHYSLKEGLEEAKFILSYLMSEERLRLNNK